MYALGIYFSLILWLSAEMAIRSFCENFLLTCLELFSAVSERGFTVVVEHSWVLVLFAEAWVERCLRLREKGVRVRVGETHRLECDAFIAEFVYAQGKLAYIAVMSLKWEPCVSAPWMLRTAFLAQSILSKMAGRGLWRRSRNENENFCSCEVFQRKLTRA